MKQKNCFLLIAFIFLLIENFVFISCNNNKLHQHKFEYQSNSKFHWTVCSECGESTDKICHEFSTCDFDEQTHLLTCICGLKNEEKHSFIKQRDDKNHWDFCTCGYTNNKSIHIFEYKNDGEFHWTVCSECEESTEKICHEFSTCFFDESTHHLTCICGLKNEEKHSFVLKNNESEHWEECFCGIEKNRSEHLFDSEWKNDDINHWQECICGIKNKEIGHTFQSDTKSNNENHWKECICGIKNHLEQHTFEYRSDDFFHWQICKCGVTTEKSEHFYIFENNPKEHWEECFCGIEKNRSEHLFDSEWKNDDINHWQECICGIKNESEMHIFGNWKIIICPTETMVGEKEKNCNICSAKKEKTIKERTYLISSAEDLRNISNYDSPTAIFELTENINGEGQPWKPISIFKGKLIGNGYSIENFLIDDVSPFEKGIAYCGFFYKNDGFIENIFFKNITISALFEDQTSDWRYVNVGTVAGINAEDGEINNVHLENIKIYTELKHKKDKSNNDVRQINISGGFVGKNYGIINYCSIKESSITALTDAKNNWCDTSTYVGGICGENLKNCSNILSIHTEIKAYSRGGYDWWIGNDGHLKTFSGNIFGVVNSNGDISKILSYDNTKALSENIIVSGSPEHNFKEGKIYGELKNGYVDNSYEINSITDFALYSPIVNSWENWFFQDIGPTNYLDM